MAVVRSLSLQPDMEPCPGYRLVQPINRGGWGEVWKARRPDGGFCALKFIACRADDSIPAVEVRALQGLREIRHPNLLPIENVWSCPGYIVVGMSLADGSLLDLLTVYLAELGQAMAHEHVCYFLGQAAEAIDFLNARRHIVHGARVAIRHCDVKPGNLLVFGSQVKLADFSLAVQVSSPLCYHRRIGTLHYSAPEVFQGWLSDRGDQYSLAVSYYQLRTGVLPFPDTPSRYSAAYVRPTPNLALLTPGEQAVLGRALTPVPQDRWPSCVELVRNLRAAVPASVPETVPAG